MSNGDYDIEIEIDAESGEVLWRHRDITKIYNVETLDNARQILDSLEGNVDITVYSQGRILTYSEYKEMVGIL